MAERGAGAAGATELPMTDAARQLLADARRESDRLRHPYVGTEHLALARGSGAASPLARYSVDGEQVRAVLDERVVPGRGAPPPTGERPYTSRTQQAFALAAESARAAGQAEVGVEHLVAGILREGMNFGAQALQSCGLTAEQADAEVRRLGGGTA